MTEPNAHPPVANTLSQLYEEPEAGALRNSLTEHLAAIPLSSEVITALSPDTMALSFLGLTSCDLTYGRNELKRRCAAILTFTSLARALSVQMGGGGRQAARSRTEEQDKDTLPRGTSAWMIAHVERSVGLGVRRSEALSPLLLRMQLLYRQESPPVLDEEALKNFRLPSEDNQELFGAAEAPEGADFDLHAAWIREVCGVDLSEETLNARFNTFVGLAQFELTWLTMDDLLVTARISRASGIKQFLAKYVGEILEGNLLHMQRTMYKIAKELRIRADAAKQGPNRRLLSLLTNRVQHTADNLDEYLQFFANIYHSLGYDVPPLLLEEVVVEETPTPRQIAVTTLAGSAATQVTIVPPDMAPAPPEDLPEEEPLPTPDPQILEEVAWRAEAWQTNADTVNDAWRLNNKGVKNAGLEALHLSLTLGFNNASGHRIIEPLPRDSARELVGVLAHLDRLAQRKDRAAAEEEIRSALSLSRELQAGAAHIRAFAAEHGVPLPHLSGALVTEDHLRRLAQNWPAYRQLILSTWPPAEAAAVAARLESFVQIALPPH